MSDRFTLREPCPGCPFGYHAESVRHLGEARIREIAEANDFPCHRTTKETGGNGTNVACAGHLIFRIAQDGDVPQLARIACRIGMVDEETYEAWHDQAESGMTTMIDLDELVEAHEEGRRR